MTTPTERPLSKSFAQFLLDITPLAFKICELQGTPEPEDARDIRDRHQKILEAVGALFERDARALREFTGADTSPEAFADIIKDTWQTLLRPELDAIEDHIIADGGFDKRRRRDPHAEHRLSAIQLGVGGRH